MDYWHGKIHTYHPLPPYVAAVYAGDDEVELQCVNMLIIYTEIKWKFLYIQRPEPGDLENMERELGMVLSGIIPLLLSQSLTKPL